MRMGYVCYGCLWDTLFKISLICVHVTIVLIIFLPGSQDPSCCLCMSMGYPTSSIRSAVLCLCTCTCVHIPTCVFFWYICYCYDRGRLLHLSPDLFLSQFCLLPFFTGDTCKKTEALLSTLLQKKEVILTYTRIATQLKPYVDWWRKLQTELALADRCYIFNALWLFGNVDKFLLKVHFRVFFPVN